MPPRGPRLPAEKMPFSTNGASGDLSVIDTGANNVIKSIPVGRFPSGVTNLRQ